MQKQAEATDQMQVAYSRQHPNSKITTDISRV
jgi:hypothetical protein